MDTPFYVIWNPAHGLPRFRHHSSADAEREAKRLATENPGQEFFVLLATAVARRPDPVEFKHLKDDIPF